MIFMNQKKKFLGIESSLNLFDFEIKGVKIWQYLRNSIFLKIYQESGQIGVAQDDIDRTLLGSIKKGMQAIFKVISNKDALIGKKRKIDLLIFNHPRRKLLNGEYWAIFTDFLLHDLKVDYQIIEKLYEKRKPPQNRNTKFIDLLILLAYIYRKLTKIELNKSEIRQLQELEKKLEEEFQTTLNLINQVKEILIMRKTYFYVYKKIMDRYKPKVIIEVVSYEIKNMILNEFCKKNDTVTIELQHGIIGDFDLAYEYPKKMEIDVFPDYFFSFGKYWEKTTQFPISDENIKTVGFPYFENECKKYQNYKKTSKILFISQGPIGKELSKFACDFANLTKEEIVYKLHPGEYKRWKKDYYYLNESPNIKVIDHDRIPIYQLFAESKTVIGVYSLALFESLMFKSDLFIVKLTGYEVFEQLIKQAYATLISTPEELLQKLMESKDYNHETFEVDYFFKKKSIKNQQRELLQILSNYNARKK